MKLTKWSLRIGIVLVMMLAYSCNGRSDNKSKKNTIIAGLALLAASQAASQSGRAALVMPECGKGFYTGETYADFSRYMTLLLQSQIVLPGCNPTSMTTGGGSSATMTYNTNRQLTSLVYGSTTALTVSYNPLNYIASKKEPCTVASAGDTTTNYEYDSSGRISKVTETSPAGCAFGGSAASSRIEDYTYSGSELFPSTIVNSYNAGVCKTTTTYTNTKNSLGYITTSVVNSSSEGTATAGCIPGSSSETTTTYSFDSSGNITSISPGGSYTFDSSNRVLSAGSTTYTYNSSGQLTSRVSGGITTTYSY